MKEELYQKENQTIIHILENFEKIFSGRFF
jgi:hypothetical protein